MGTIGRSWALPRVRLVRTEDSLTPPELRHLRNGELPWWSQEQFADWLGIASNTYARMERGELPIRPPLARLVICVVAENTKQSVESVRAALEERRAATKPTSKATGRRRPKPVPTKPGRQRAGKARRRP